MTLSVSKGHGLRPKITRIYSMSPLIRIPLGIAIMFVGFLMVKKTEVFLSWFGQVPFAEDKFGPGGSRLFY